MASPYYWLTKKINKKSPNTENSRHAKKSWLKRVPKITFSKIVLFLTIVFLFIPLIIIVAESFHYKDPETLAESNLSLHWYKELLFGSGEVWDALFNSIIIAVSSSVVATILGTTASIGINWHKFAGKSYIQTISFLPMVLPEVIIGAATVIFFSGIKLKLGMFTIFAAHTTFCLPFVYMMVNARLDEFDHALIEASYDLGANEFETLTKVTVPAIMPGILSGFMMAITMSLEDFVITFFVSGPGSTTLPIYIYSMIRFGVSPVINSLSLVMIIMTCIIAFFLRKGLKTIAASK